MDFIKDKLSGQPGGRILDVATQEGGFIVKLKEIFSGFDEAVGIDISEKWIEKARSKFEGEPVRFIMMDGASLEFDDDSFDTVAICVALHHLPDTQKTLQEMKRVLRSGGRFIVREMYCDDQNDKQMAGILSHHWQAKIHRLKGISHNSTMTRREIVDLIDSIGLSEYETGEYVCRDEEYTIAEIIESEVKSHAELLADVKGDPAHDELKRESDKILLFMQKVGLDYPGQLDIVGVK